MFGVAQQLSDEHDIPPDDSARSELAEERREAETADDGLARDGHWWTAAFAWLAEQTSRRHPRV
jgi:hypothetical protein